MARKLRSLRSLGDCRLVAPAPSVWREVAFSEGLQAIAFPERSGDAFTPECLGGSSARRKSLGNEIPERPDAKKKTNGEPTSAESIDETPIS